MADKLEITKEFLEDLYIKQGETVAKISKLFWTKDFFNETKMIETLPSLKDKNDNFHCYSIYR